MIHGRKDPFNLIIPLEIYPSKFPRCGSKLIIIRDTSASLNV